MLTDYFNHTPFIAILRGIKPKEVLAIAEILLESGIRVIEVPLNSPEPYRSIEQLANRFGDEAMIGAGTVMTQIELAQVNQAGGQLIVSPHTNAELIRATKTLGLLSVPGFFTPTEAVTAIHAGADALKLFPAENTSPRGLRAIRAILPQTMPVLPVGGIKPDILGKYLAVGAAGFGLGAALYQAGMTPEEVETRVQPFVDALQ